MWHEQDRLRDGSTSPLVREMREDARARLGTRGAGSKGKLRAPSARAELCDAPQGCSHFIALRHRSGAATRGGFARKRMLD